VCEACEGREHRKESLFCVFLFGPSLVVKESQRRLSTPLSLAPFVLSPRGSLHAPHKGVHPATHSTTPMGRGRKPRGAKEADQYGGLGGGGGGDGDDHDHTAGGSGRGGGAGGGGGRAAKGGGPSVDLQFTRHVPKFLAGHAHLLKGADNDGPAGVEGDEGGRRRAGENSDDDLDAADRADALAAAVAERPDLAAQHPELAAAAARVAGEAAKVKGNAHFAGGRWDEAVGAFTAALAALGAGGDPDPHAEARSVYLSNRSAAHGAAGRWGEALGDAKAAASARPGWPKGWARVGEAAAALGRPGETVAAYEQAIAAAGGPAAAPTSLGEALHRARIAEAKAVAERKHAFVPKQATSTKRPAEEAPADAAAAPAPKRAAPPPAPPGRPTTKGVGLSFDPEEEEDG